MAAESSGNIAKRAADAWTSLSVEFRVAIVLIAAGLIMAGAIGLNSFRRPVTHEMIPLLGGHDFSLEGRESAIKAFQEARLADYSLAGTKILVPRDKEADYLSALAASNGGLPGGTDEAMDRYIAEQRSWWASTSEAARLFHVAEQRRVAHVVETFPEIDHASVLVSQPPERGTLRSRIGHSTAAVKVATVDGRALHPQRIDQIKQLVDGAFLDITSPEQVVVVQDALPTALGAISGAAGPDPSLVGEGPSQYMMTKAAFELQIENKMRELFADLSGLIVKVNAELDPRYSRTQRIDMREKGPLRRESVESSTSETVTPPVPQGGEPGTRTNVDIPGTAPNQGALAASAAVAPSAQNDETSEREFDNTQTLSDQSFVDFEPVSVGVVVRYRIPPQAQGQSAAAGPTPQQIREMIASLGYPGVTVDGVQVQPYEGEEPEPISIAEPSWTELLLRQVPSISLAVLGMLAIIVALALARRAPIPKLARTVELDHSPRSVSDVGVPSVNGPPKDEATVRAEQLHDQLNAMVKENPEAAASLLRRWVTAND